MRHIPFFALKEDLLPVLEVIERTASLTYVPMGNALEREFSNPSFTLGSEIPRLGQASGDSASGCDAYLISEVDVPINVRCIKAATGGDRLCVDQLINPDTVVFAPGGTWGEDTIVEGNVGTASESERSQALMKRFHTAIRKQFTKVKAFYVGPGARSRLEAGARLTASARSPHEFDLTIQ